MLKSDPRFNGATAFQPWNFPRLRSGSTAREGFNGATAFQPWNSRTVATRTSAVTASMGPRHFSRGIDFILAPTPMSNHELQWGHGISAVEFSHHRRLDGEPIGASMGPRHFSRGIGGSTVPGSRGSIASMGPRHFSRGIDCYCDYIASHYGSFNGATAFQPWNLRTVHLYVHGATASMGPRHFSRGIGSWESTRKASHSGASCEHLFHGNRLVRSSNRSHLLSSHDLSSFVLIVYCSVSRVLQAFSTPFERSRGYPTMIIGRVAGVPPSLL